MTSVDEFARTFIEELRNPAIREIDFLLTDNANGIIAQEWRRRVPAGCVASVGVLVPDIVDLVLGRVLQAIDNEELPFWWRQVGSAGDPVRLEVLGLGEMSGWLLADDGWRARFSKERFTAWYRKNLDSSGV